MRRTQALVKRGRDGDKEGRVKREERKMGRRKKEGGRIIRRTKREESGAEGDKGGRERKKIKSGEGRKER